MAWIEIAGRRFKKIKHFYNPDTGKFRAKLTIHDQHYQDEVNLWQNIDETIVDDTTVPGYIAKCDKVKHIIRFGSAGERRWYPRRNVTNEYVDTSKPDYFDTNNHWRPWNLTGLTRNTNSITWETIDYKVSITNTWHRVKLEYILKTVDAPTHIRFPLSLTGLIWNNGNLIGLDSQIAGAINEPTAFDANGFNLPISGVYLDGYYEINCDVTGAIYPVSIDPTFTDGEGGDVTTAKDTWLVGISGYEGRNYGVSQDLRVGGGRWGVKGLLQFDVSSIPSDATCDTATLSLCYFGWNDAAGTKTIYAHKILSGNAGWFEGTHDNANGGANESCWNYKDQNPGNLISWAGNVGLDTAGTDYKTTESGSLSQTNTQAAGYYDWDLLPADIEDWWALSDNYGLKLADDWGDNSGTPKYRSSDYTTASERPILVIEYTLPTTEYIDGYGGDVNTAKDSAFASGNSDRSKGSDETLYPQPEGEYAVIQFNLSAIPAGSTCVSATISLYNAEEFAANDRTLYAYEFLAANDGWIAGVTADPAVDNQSTWDFKNQTGTGTGTAWAGGPGADLAGTDHNASAIGSATYIANTPIGSEIPMSLNTTDVEDWFGASNANYGLILKTGAVRFPTFYTAEYSTTGYRPKLVVQYIAPSGQTVEETVTLDNHIGVSTSSQTNENDVTTLDSHIGVTVVEEVGGEPIEETVGLTIYLSVTQPRIEAVEENVSLAVFKGISSVDQISVQDVATLTRNAGQTSTDLVNVSDNVPLAKLDGIANATNVNVFDTTILAKFIAYLNEGALPGIEESTILARFASISDADQLSIFDGIVTSYFDGLTIASDRPTIEESVILGRISSIGIVDQTNINDVIDLVDLRNIVISSNTVENDATTLAIFDDITILEETQGFANEIVTLTRSNDITVLQESVSHVNEEVTLNRLSGIGEETQCQINDATILADFVGITALEEVRGFINETVILARFTAIEVMQESVSHVSEEVNLNRLTEISEIAQNQASDNILLTRSVTIETLLEGISHVNEGVSVNRLAGIGENAQYQVNDNITLVRSIAIETLLEGISHVNEGVSVNRLVGINETTQCRVNDYSSLAKFIQITVTEETQGNYSETVIFNRFLSLAALAEGISHVNEGISISRSNIIAINEQSSLYNSLIFGRLNGISIGSQSQIFNNLIFSKSNGLNISPQSLVNENITANKFSGLSTNSQIIVPELINLSQLYGLAILDSRYLLESVDLQYSNGLSLLDSPTIFERIQLGRIDIVTIITALVGYNNINLGQYKSIIAEPPSLYVYNDGNHSAIVLFRDKRAPVPWRDKRSGK